MAYVRFLGQYGNNEMSDRDYWVLLGLLQGGYFILCILRYFLLNLVVLFSNEKLH